MDNFLQCSSCKQWLPKSCFTVNRAEKRGYQYRCRECDNKRRRRDFDKNPEQNKKACSRYYNNNKRIHSIRMKSHKFPLDNCCLFCESTEELERAHYNYEKPENFFTACRGCHRKFDALVAKITKL